MSGYAAFADVYDLLTENVPYDEIAAYYDRMISRFGGKKGLLLDLGCGTGNLSVRFSALGYDVIAADVSQQMLSIAVMKPHEGVQYICQNMTEIDLYGEVDVAVSTLDSINHLNSAEDIQMCFQSAAQNIVDGGLFLFDVNTIYKHREILADNTFVYDVDEVYCVWNNEFDESDGSVAIDLDLFLENEDGTYSRTEENFREIALSEQDIVKYLSFAGFDTLAVFEYLTENQPKEKSEKLFFVARKMPMESKNGKTC